MRGTKSASFRQLASRRASPTGQAVSSSIQAATSVVPGELTATWAAVTAPYDSMAFAQGVVGVATRWQIEMPGAFLFVDAALP